MRLCLIVYNQLIMMETGGNTLTLNHLFTCIAKVHNILHKADRSPIGDRSATDQ